MVKRCGSCDLNIPAREASVTCNACKVPFHERCSQLADDEFKILASQKSSLKWFCRLCDPQILEILTNFEKLKKFSSEIKTIRQEIDQKIQDLDNRINPANAQRVSCDTALQKNKFYSIFLYMYLCEIS